METIKPRKNFNFEEDRESIDRVIEKYMADTFKVTFRLLSRKVTLPELKIIERLFPLIHLQNTKMIALNMQN